MSETIYSAISLVAVGLLWGVTNPFIKKGSKGMNKLKDSGSKIKNFLLEAKFIFKRLDYWIPFAINQFGSVLYVATIQKTQLSLGVPIANAFSFLFTAVTGSLLGEQIPGKDLIIGTTFITIGTGFLIYDKILRD
ncbi:TMEM234 family protein [Megaselia abdita]